MKKIKRYRLRFRKIFLISVAFLNIFCIAQNSPIAPRGTPLGSRSDISANYFQQGVYYTINAELDTESHIIYGAEQLIYRNNSSDTLDFVYFHLYQNAYLPDSHADHLWRSEGDYSVQRSTEGEWGGTIILSLLDNSDQALLYQIDDTIMKVRLNQPLIPGDYTVFNMQFETKFSELEGRMHFGEDYYVAAHWYPKIVVYDARRGWNKDYHLGHEFYGDFGTYEWTLTLPAHYILEGTGFILNRSKVLPDTLMEKLDISNFSEKPFKEAASSIIPPTEETKTWKFKAENVHNIAWIASPNFRIGVTEWGGIKCYSLAREQHAAKWQDSAEIGIIFIKDYSKRYGKYQYHKMIVSDVEDGMEYPMLTADSGTSPRNRGLLGHEIGHNWFYGQVGSNETYRAYLDEGFTNFITCTTMDSIWGAGSDTYWKNWYGRHFYPEATRKYRRNDLVYHKFVRTGFENNPLNTHSDHFDEYRGYRLVYSKGATMLFNLQYALGTPVFNRVMRTYFDRFLFQHPYPEDFQKVAQEVSGRDLDWFFEQWLNTIHKLDYAITNVKTIQNDDNLSVKIKLKRKESMQMPLDIQLQLSDGTIQMVHVPNRTDQVKPVADDWTITEPWIGWGDLNKYFEFKVPIAQPVKKAVIDPSGRLADVYRLDNTSGITPPVKIHFDNMAVYYPSLSAYDIYWRPTLRMNEIDGYSPGIFWKSGYMLSDHVRQWHTSGAFRYGIDSYQWDYQFFAETSIIQVSPLSHVFLSAEESDGRQIFELGYTGQFRKKLYEPPYHAVELYFRFSTVMDTAYIPVWQNWDTGEIRTITLKNDYHHKIGDINVEYSFLVESSIYTSDFQFSKQFFTIQHWFNTILPIKTRLFAGNQSVKIPRQMAFRLSGASYFDAFLQNWLYRSKPLVAAHYLNAEHVRVDGGGNLMSAISWEDSLDWMAGINMKVDLSSKIKMLSKPKILRKYLPIETFIMGSFVVFKIEDRSNDLHSVAEAGFGCRIPLVFIPESVGIYNLRLNYVWPLLGDGLENKWVFSVESVRKRE